MDNLVQNAVPAGVREHGSITDPEEPEFNDPVIKEPEGKIEWNDYFKNPKMMFFMLWVPMLQLAGVLGLIVFIVSAVTYSQSLEICAGIILIVAGFSASFEIWSLGSLENQIEFLKNIRQELENHTQKMKSEVNNLHGENAEMDENLNFLDKAGDELKEIVEDMDQANTKLNTDNVELKKQNEHLQESVETMKDRVDNLTDNVDSLQTANDELQETLKQFDPIRKQMEETAEMAGEELSDKIEEMLDRFRAVDEMIADSDEVALTSVFENVVNLDKRATQRGEEVGLNKMEYRRFIRAIPSRFKGLGLSLEFDDLDKDGSGVISVSEMKETIGELVALQTEKRKNAEKIDFDGDEYNI